MQCEGRAYCKYQLIPWLNCTNYSCLLSVHVHDQVPSVQAKFKSHVQTQLQNLASIFLDSKEVVSLSSKNVADASVVTTINEMVTAVPSICKRWDCSNSIGETTPKNKLAMFKLTGPPLHSN